VTALSLPRGHGAVIHQVLAGLLLGVRRPLALPAPPSVDGAGGALSSGDLLWPRAAPWDPPSIPAWARTLWRGGRGGLFPTFPLPAGGSSRRRARLAAFIDFFCSNKADGAELKTKITQNNPKPGRGWEGKEGGCCKETLVVPKGRDRLAPLWGQGWGVWVPEAGEARGGTWRQSRAPGLSGMDTGDLLGPWPLGGFGPEPSPHLPPSSIPPRHSLCVHPPSPSRVGPSPASPVPTGPCLQPGTGLGLRAAARVSRWGGGRLSPASLVGLASPSSVPRRRGGGRGQSSAATLGRAAEPGGGEGVGGLSWGCGSGWLRCCRSPGTRWT